MKFVVFKVINTHHSKDLAEWLALGCSVVPAASIPTINGQPAVAAAAAKAEAEAKPARRRRRRRRALQRLTADKIREMKALREKGLLYRVIGRRYGVSEARAWQIVNREGQTTRRAAAKKETA